MKTFNTVLVANRGVIAKRIMRTCKELGLKTVGIYTSQDESMQFNTFADHMVKIPELSEHSGYMNAQAIIEAAQMFDAAIHPGYGFLSEKASFRKACDQAGVVFIGPSESVLSLAGDKSACHQQLEKEISMCPSFYCSEYSQDSLKQAQNLGFPLLLKPAHGGGGIGMKLVNSLEEFETVLLQTMEQANHLFGNGTILIEKFLTNVKHIEVQMIADSHGNRQHLFERECSLQRRRQKVVEEAPSPSLNEQQRQNVYQMAHKIADLIQLDQMATIEFLFSEDNFYFLEINPRLQVEHGVTEMITGLDLVEWQLKVAQGESIENLSPDSRGHCIESRIYAEDPITHLPAPGLVDVLNLPDGHGLRLESYLWQGMEVSSSYDPLLMKVMTHGEDRNRAINKMLLALQNLDINGSLKVNTQALIQSFQSKAFNDGSYDTSTFESLDMLHELPDWHQDLIQELLKETQPSLSEARKPRQTTQSFWRPSFWKNPY